jgi:CRP/FNR family transcriptional regulator, cyclic AMP receptor protein
VTKPKSLGLEAVPLLAPLPPEAFRVVARSFSVRAYAKGSIVVSEGDHLDRFHVILSGSVQAFWRDESGKELKLGLFGPGEHFADVTLGGQPSLLSFIAVTDLRVATIPLPQMHRLLRTHPQVATRLLMDVIGSFRRLLERSKALAMDGVYRRVEKLLLANGTTTGRGGEAIVRMTHAEIGRRVGATREMVGRVLRDLARGGYVRIERGRVTVLRPPPVRW